MTVKPESAPTPGGDEAEAPKEEPKNGSPSSLLGVVAQISGVISVVAGTIYVLGMLTLLLPIYKAYDTNFSTAWYMVSVVPKTVVAGHGARSLIWPSLATVLPMAFIVVMILVLVSLLWVGVRHAARGARAAKSDLSRGVLFITAAYAGYSVVLGGVLLAAHFLFQSISSDVFQTLLQYHVVAASLAYGIFALLCVLALSLLTLRAATYATKLVRSRAFTYESLRSLGSLRVALHLALYVGMVSAVVSGLELLYLSFNPEEQFSSDPLVRAWVAVLVALIFLIPMVLLLLLVDRAIPLKTFDGLSPIFRALGIALRMFSIVAVVGLGLMLISYLFFVEFDIAGVSASPHVATTLDDIGTIVLHLVLLLSPGLLLVLLLGKLIPTTVHGVSGAMLKALLAVVVMSSGVLALTAYIVVSYVAKTGFLAEDVTGADRALLISSGVLSVAAILLFVLHAGRYVLRLVMNRNIAPARFRSLLVRRVKDLKSRVGSESVRMLRYAGIFFVVFYLVLFVTFLYGRYVIFPLYDNINSVASSKSRLDELFVRLSIVGGIVSGVLLYFKGLFFHTREDLFSAESWRSFLGSFRRAVLPSSIRRGFVWCLGGAYVFSLVVASLIAFLEPPPLPRVEMSFKENSSQQWLTSSGAPAPGFQSETKRLLAHTDGHWYLFDERKKQLLVVPDGDDYAVRFPEHVEIVDSTGAVKIEVPIAWDEVDDKIRKVRDGHDYVDLVASTNVDNWAEGYGEEPGVNITAQRGPWDADTVDKILDSYKNDIVGTECKYVSRRDHEVANEGPVLRGKVATWEDCGGEDNTFIAAVLLPEDRKSVVVLEIDMPKEGEEEDVEHVLNNFWVDGTLLPSA